MSYRFHVCGLREEIGNFCEKGFIFIQINKLKMKSDSIVKHINSCHYLEFKMPILYRQFLKKYHKI